MGWGGGTHLAEDAGTPKPGLACGRGCGGQGWRGKGTRLKPEPWHSLASVLGSLLPQPGKQAHVAQLMEVPQVRATVVAAGIGAE